MDLFLGLVLLLPFLTIVIAIHEAGHFYFARRFGMKVHEYFIGFGPWKVWSRRKGELEYGVKAMLGGGYVKIAGMNPYEQVPEEDVPRAYYSKPIWQRAIVILAGPLSHFLVAALMFGGLLAVVGDGETKTLVGNVTQNLADGSVSPAAEAGLQAGDVLVRAGDVVDPNQAEFGEAIQGSVGEPMSFTVQRGDERFDVSMTPVLDCVDGSWGGMTGIELDGADPGGPAVVRSVVETLPDGSTSPAPAPRLPPRPPPPPPPPRRGVHLRARRTGPADHPSSRRESSVGPGDSRPRLPGGLRGSSNRRRAVARAAPGPRGRRAGFQRGLADGQAVGALAG